VSEWYDKQNQRSSNFRKLLQEQIEKINLHRELTAEEAKCLCKLQPKVEKLKRGEKVQNRKIHLWLSENEYAHYMGFGEFCRVHKIKLV
jgi:hypothetical protein